MTSQRPATPRSATDPAGHDAPAEDGDDDRRLIAAHLAGDTEAFGTLIHRHQDRLWAVAVRTLGDREEAADALQDALVSAYRRAATYRGEAAVTTWLHRIVVNACLDRVRRRAARPTVPLPDQDLAVRVDEHDQATTRIAVRAALERLPEQQRAAIVLVDLHGLSVAEAAEVLGVAEGTVKSRCSRGRSTLASILRPGVTDPDPAGPGAGPERGVTGGPSSGADTGQPGNQGPARDVPLSGGGGAPQGSPSAPGGARRHPHTHDGEGGQT